MLQAVSYPGGAPDRQVTVCEVCRLVDGDCVPKWCRWCNDCKAWICDADWKNMARRATAAFLRRWGQ